MKHLSMIVLLLLPLGLAAQEGKWADALLWPRIVEREITVGGPEADIPGFDHESIQLAIDALWESGGTVRLDPGLYTIAAPVRLRSHVDLQGTGEDCILRRGKGVQSPYVVDADYAELKVTVEDPAGFEIGMKVQVTDERNNSCWNVSTAYITDIEGNTLYIDRGLIRDYRSDQNGLISNASSVIEVIDAMDVRVSDLVVDGNRAENFFADGCNSAGVLILRSGDITLEGLQVRDFNGEGISWQTTEHVTVRHCEVSGSGNTGLHPGTGSPFSVIENNDIHDNDRDGLFVCWRVYQSTVRGNHIYHNGRYGICTGHKDVDVLFEDNHIHDNGSDGVHLRGERESNAPHRNTFLGNVIENNGTKGEAYGFSIQSPAKDLILKGNTFGNEKGTQKAAIYVYKGGLAPRLEVNHFDQHEMGELVFEAE